MTVATGTDALAAPRLRSNARKSTDNLSISKADDGSPDDSGDDVFELNQRDTRMLNNDLTPFKQLDIPRKYRLIALVSILFYTTGAAFAESTLGPLKSTFVKELNINSAYSAQQQSAQVTAELTPRCAVRNHQHGQ